MVILGTK